MSKVQILLSYFKGEKFIDDQLLSIKNQKTQANIEVLLRDDGSNDPYIDKFGDIEHLSILRGEPLGVKKSFFQLITLSDDSAEYYCFCDQDDYWMPEKIQDGINLLESYEDIPAVLFTKTVQVDCKLVPIGLDSFENGVFNFPRNILKNNAIGCTMMFNKKMRDILKNAMMNYTYVSEDLLHDHITYAVCNGCGGKVLFDENPSVFYRQHNDNVIGNRNGILIKLKANGLLDSENRRSKWAEELSINFGPILTDQNSIFLQDILNYKNKIRTWLKMIIDNKFESKSYLEKVNIFVLFLLKKF